MANRQDPALHFSELAVTALAPVLWGTTYIVATEFLPPDRPLIAAVLRCLPAGLLLLLAFPHQPRRADFGRLLVLSALNIGLFQWLLFVAAWRLPGGLAAVLGAVQPILVMALIWAVDGQRPAIRTLGAALGGVAGMALMLASPEMRGDPLGVAAALAGAASMATGVWLTRRWQFGMPIAALTGWQLLLGGALLLPAALTLEPALPGLTTLQAAGYAWLCLAGALLAYVLWFRGIARLPSTAVSALALLSPVTATALGWVFLGQAMRPPALFGMALVLTSIALVQRSATRQEPGHPSHHQAKEKS